MKINIFATHFANINDPRQLGNVKYNFFGIMLLMISAVISAVISAAEGWEDIEIFGEERLDYLRLFEGFE